MKKLYQLRKIGESTMALYVPKGIPAPETFSKVSFGSLSCECKVLLHPEGKEEILITEDLFKKLKIPFTRKIHLIAHDGAIHLGPLVGVFTAGFTDSLLRPVGERSLFFAKLTGIDEVVGTCSFVFGAPHIDWEKGLIQGYFFTKTGWQVHEVPFPNVVYDRLPNRKTESHRALRKIIRKLKEEYLIPWFNPGFFNKWDIHKMLRDDPAAASYLPETLRKFNFEQLEIMLSKYHHIFLKPAAGSLGNGVFQVIYSREENAYYCRYRDEHNENRLRKFQSLEKLASTVFKKRNMEDYIAQQGISLIRIDSKTVDFRVHTNKNREGRWQIGVIAAKISGRGSVTTHCNNGGVVRTVEEIFPSESQKMIERLKEAALTLSASIDSKIDGFIGEIGFDLGIDKNGQIWLFEANSKPGRSIFSHPKLKDHDMLTRKLSLEYAVHLTEKMIQKPEDLFQ